MSNVYVHLGRFGDIINTLPLLQRIASEEGRPTLVVAKPYASVLDGVSYVEPVVWDGAFEDLRGALEWTRTWAPNVINLQVYGRDMSMPRHTSSFVLEQWHRAGRAWEWGAPLHFDKRDPAREAELVHGVRYGASRVPPVAKDPMPIVLVATTGFSSPFPYGSRLLNLLNQELDGRARVVDLNEVKCERIYDLLALYDAAAVLVAIDSAHQHLAHGSKVPVVALSTSGPTPWHSSPRRQGHVLHVKYNDYPAQEQEILRTVLRYAEPRPAPTLPLPKILHVYPSHAMTGEPLRRHLNAMRCWEQMYSRNWRSLAYTVHDGIRSARTVGDTRDLPYMHDMINHAIAQGTSDEDIVLVSNSDVGMVPDMESRIRRTIARYGAFYTHRWDFTHPIDPATQPARGRWYPGSDAFGFTIGWWRRHGPAYPDMLVGAEYVDCVLRQLIKLHADPDAEVHGAVFHEKHDSAWEKERRSPSNQHNARLARTWFAEQGTDDLDPFNESAARAIRERRQHMKA